MNSTSRPARSTAVRLPKKLLQILLVGSGLWAHYSACRAETVIRVSSETMNMSKTGPRNLLPHFVNTTIEPVEDTRLSDTCPDDIWENLINQSAPALPYRLVDDYTRDGAEGTAAGSMPTIVVESDGLVATFFPATGGKMASLQVKLENGTRRELLFRNPVYQPAELARLNAWTSGGVEWNWPRLGHTVFTSAPVFVAEVETDRRGSPLLRIYEFDREMNTTYQVDVWIPGNGTRTAWVHVKVSNPNTHPIPAYWWTNIGVPINEASRVVLEADFALVSSGAKGASRPLARVPFPIFSDGDGYNASFRPTDHSYPAAYGVARENFIRENPATQGKGVQKFMSLHDGSGEGTLHAQSAGACGGRKYWVWGDDGGNDDKNMDFLSSPGRGSYIEMQAGPAPTQLQTFPLAASSTHEWTESFSSLNMRSEHDELNGPFQAAVAAVKERLESDQETSSVAFEDADAWLRQQADVPASKVLHRGGAWGALHAALLNVTDAYGFDLPHSVPFDTSTNVPLSACPGCDFGSLDEALAADPAARPWASLLLNGSFSMPSVDAVQQSFMVDDAWVSIMQHRLNAVESHVAGSGADSGAESLFLHLHLGIAAQHRADLNAALLHYNFSEAHALARRNRAIVYFQTGEVDAAFDDLHHAWQVAVRVAKDGAGSATTAGGVEPAVCPASATAGPPPRVADAQRDVCPSSTFLRNLAAEIVGFQIVNQQWTSLKAFLQGVQSLAKDAPRASRALDASPDLGVALAFSNFYVDNDPAACLDFLSKAKLARKSMATGLLPQLWTDAQYAKKAAELGRELAVLERLHVRQQHPVPPNINFAGAT